MNNNLNFNRVKSVILIGSVAFVINSVFVFSLPLVDFLKTNSFGTLLAVRDKKLEAVKVNLETPPKKKPKIKPRVEPKSTEINRKFDARSDRFQLDLGVNQGTGAGVAISENSQKNIIFSQNEVEVDPIRTGGRTPVIPQAFIDLNQEGRVDLEVVIDENGEMVDARLLQEDPVGFGLKESALSAIKTWKFKPARINRIPVKVRVIIPFIY